MQPEKRIIVGAHYDSLDIVRKPDAPEVTPEGGEPAADDVIDFEKSIEAPAPGVTDNAAGTALVLELARVMSQYKFEKTIVFITFAGEEIGLVGSSLYSSKAKEHKDQIEAVLNNDVVGVAVSGDGHAENGLVHVFSEEPADSASRELARYIRETAQRYVPAFKAEPVFRQDRFSRGGDHSPFNANGFAAVRFTSAAENLGIQHSANDTFDKSSPEYATFVAKRQWRGAGQPCAGAFRTRNHAGSSNRRGEGPKDAHGRARQVPLRCRAALERRAGRRSCGLRDRDPFQHRAFLGTADLCRER
jgi:Zn-dependent M28 family amino/carboxypeptidase